jgi:acetoin utilization deacetylase AcuC-like enzyme
MKKTGLVYSPIFLEHETGAYHPENKNRLISILNKLQEKTYLQEVPKFLPNKASSEDILAIHTEDYLYSLEKISGKSGYLDGDTPYSSKTLDAAYFAAGSGILLADKIISGELTNGLALVRPPGHHAESDHAMGFCFFNNVAITAKYLQKKGLSKIAILDWDVHHGNGTQNSFYDDESVLFISTHQYPFYPGTGAATEIGIGKGTGATLNVPMQRGSGNSEYLKAFREIIVPKLESFQPDILLISAGFDAHKRDPLSGIELTTSAYEEFSVLMKKFARDFTNGRIISLLEGGYDLEALADSTEVHLSVLLD